jgi:hypothetical protein
LAAYILIEAMFRYVISEEVRANWSQIYGYIARQQQQTNGNIAGVLKTIVKRCDSLSNFAAKLWGN